MSSNAISAQGSILQIATGTGGAKTVTAISKGYPCIVTSTAHGFAAGDRVTFASVGGMTELNGNSYVIEYVTANTFSLHKVDSTSYTTYTSGGTATPVTHTAIAEVKSYSGFDGQASEIDVTDFASTAKEFRLGLVDEGGFSFEMHQLNSNPGQQALRASRNAGTLKSYKLILPNAEVATFNAFAKSLPSAGSVDGVVTSSVALRISGPVVWS
jgi:hypothetical protein